MVKYLLNFLVLFLMFSPLAFAHKSDEPQLQQEYGKDLTHAPFFLRFTFSKEYNKDWDKSLYSERRAFLHNYDAGIAAQQAQDKADAKAEALKQKKIFQQQKMEARAERDKLRAEADQEKVDAKAEYQREKAFDTSVSQQQKTIDDMQRESTRGTGLISAEEPNPNSN